MEASSTMINSENRPASAVTKGSIPASLQLSLSDQLYRQAKIDEENRRLKKKSKADGGSSKKGKKSKKSDDAAADDNEDDLYPTIKVTRGGELPEGVHESDNEDKDYQEPVGKNKKADPHRALNIDLDAKAIPKMPAPPVQVPEPPPKPVEVAPPAAEKPKKAKKKKTSEKEEKPTAGKTKAKRERSDYKELLSPADDEEKRGISPSASTTTISSATVPVEATATSATPEDKPKKKKSTTTTSKEKKSSKENANPAPLLFDIMGEDINSNYSSNQPSNEEIVYKLAGQSDHLSIVSRAI
jgi:hypothetical protein